MSNTRPLPDYYKILEVTSEADGEGIKKAYRQLALQHHPDKNRGRELEAEEKFKVIQEAYDVLGNPTKKFKYDREISLQKKQTQASSYASNSKFRFSAKAPEFKPGGSSSDAMMTEIKTTSDLAKFVGKIISFEVSEIITSFRIASYTIMGKMFAYVSEELVSIPNKSGGKLCQAIPCYILQIRNCRFSPRDLGSHNLPSLSLKARLASSEEIDLIKKAGETNQAWFPSYNDHLWTDIFNKPIHQSSPKP